MTLPLPALRTCPPSCLWSSERPRSSAPGVKSKQGLGVPGASHRHGGARAERAGLRTYPSGEAATRTHGAGLGSGRGSALRCSSTTCSSESGGARLSGSTLCAWSRTPGAQEVGAWWCGRGEQPGPAGEDCPRSQTPGRGRRAGAPRPWTPELASRPTVHQCPLVPVSRCSQLPSSGCFPWLNIQKEVLMSLT